jgi:hypothetical protein
VHGPFEVAVNHRPGGEPATFESTHGFTFISDLLSPGNHTATLEWRDNGLGSGCVHARNLIILHR